MCGSEDPTKAGAHRKKTTTEKPQMFTCRQILLRVICA